MEPKLLLDDISKLLKESKRKVKKRMKGKCDYQNCGGKGNREIDHLPSSIKAMPQ